MPILVLTADPLPLPGLPATGAGLRAWALAEGLRSAGLEARAVMPSSILAGRDVSHSSLIARHTYPDSDLREFLTDEHPDVVVMQHWGMMSRVGEIDCPVAIDLAGPHLLERLYWGQKDLSADREQKIAALRRADYVVCSGHWQRMYFLPWLMMAGFEAENPELCPVIPFSWAPEGPPPRAIPPGQGESLTFVAGGVLLPWQNPLPSLQILLEEMDRAGKGRLVFCGGPHPSISVSGGETVKLLEALQSHPRVEMKSLMPFEEWLALIGRCDVAYDILPANAERTLAFPTRTSMYLWNGLPVIHGNYDELGAWIHEEQAGWAVAPENESAIRQTIRTLLEKPSMIDEAAAQARRLAQKRLDWSKSIEPLAEFCRHPTRRKLALSVGKDSGITEDSTRVLSLQRDLCVAQSEVAALKGKWPFRLARRLKALGWIAAPVLYPLLVLQIAAIVALVFVSDLLGKKRIAPAFRRDSDH